MLDRLKNDKAHIGIIGLGYVGLPLSIAFVDCFYFGGKHSYWF